MDSNEPLSWRQNNPTRLEGKRQPPRYRRGRGAVANSQRGGNAFRGARDNTRQPTATSLGQGRSRKQAWSKLVWAEGAAGAQSDVHGSPAASPSNESQPMQRAIGFGRATGLSRVPDASLSNSPELVRKCLDNVLARSKALEQDGVIMVNVGGEGSSTASLTSDKALEAWEPILAEFRRLTMSITASSNQQVQEMALDVYEAAADACLLAGNLSFYLSCQTRLLELYDERAHDAQACNRKLEFTSYAMLYFGVFCVDRLELAMLMRVMTKKTKAASDIQFALSAVTAFQARDGASFVSLFQTGSLHQKTILSTGLDAMKKCTMEQMTCAYMTLDKSYAWSLLGSNADAGFLSVLQDVRPDLAALVDLNDNNTEYCFRVPRKAH